MKTLILHITISFSICCLLLSSCSKLFGRKDDDLSIVRRNYDGDELRIDGYYYSIGYKGEIIDGYWFYRNGVLISTGGITHSFEEMDNYMLTFINNNHYKTRKIAWGVFDVIEDSIAFERWYPHGPNRAYVSTGKILNDTTFHIIDSYRMENGVKTDRKERDEMYYFRAFEPKPDSTNSFVR